MRNPFCHGVYSISNFKTRLEMPLMEMRITDASVAANLHDNSGVGTFLLRIHELHRREKVPILCKSIVLVLQSCITNLFS